MTGDLPETLPLSIVQAGADDLADILELYSQAGIDSGRKLTLEEARFVFAKVCSYPDYKLYVARLEQRLAGSFALLIMDNLGHQGTPAGIVEAVAVHPSLQGRGIGKAMMKYAMKKCEEAGCYKLALTSNSKRTEAHQFYESLGFDRHGYSFICRLR